MSIVIVAKEEKGNTGTMVMGSERRSTKGGSVSQPCRKIRKVGDGHGRGDVLVGAVGTNRVLQQFKFEIEIPYWKVLTERVIYYDVRKPFEKIIDKDDRWRTSHIFTQNGNIFVMDGVCVFKVEEDFHAIGSPEDSVLGAMEVMRGNGLSARAKVKKGLEIAVKMDISVDDNFDFLEIKYKVEKKK